MLKRIIFSRTTHIIFLLLILWLVFPLTKSQAESPISVIVNGRVLEMDVSPIIRNGRVFVPIRAISRVLRAETRFFPEHNAVAVYNNTLAISFSIGFDIITVFDANGNGRPTTMESPVFVCCKIKVPKVAS